ncbi:MAG: response regulator transcription factor [Myxococcota bacterium]
MSRVLVVDADEARREALTGALAREWIRAEAVASGEEALAALEEGAPGVVVIDARLPGLTGVGLLHQLRRDPRRAHLRVVLVSPRDEELDRCVALELGADDVVDRPFSVRELVLRVRALLRGPGA